jgi:hypothetical protein
MPDPVMRPTAVDPASFLAAVPHAVRRGDGEVVLRLMEDLTGQPARMWGPSIIGFGSYHYRYASGHQGDAAAVGFSPRKAHLVLYGLTYDSRSEALLPELGKHRRGAGCLYVNRLADVDSAILGRLIRDGYQYATSVLHSPHPS